MRIFVKLFCAGLTHRERRKYRAKEHGDGPASSTSFKGSFWHGMHIYTELWMRIFVKLFCAGLTHRERRKYRANEHGDGQYKL